MRLLKLLEGLSGWTTEEKTEDLDREICGISIDSQQQRADCLFVCIKGENVDSHDLVREAEKNGAVAIVAERKVKTDLPVIYVEDTRGVLGQLASLFYGEPSKRLKIIGITGTNGKTTTSYMLASIIKSTGKKVGVIGTLGVHYGKKHIPSKLTTPNPIDLHAYFADMVAVGVEYVVMEVSAHALHYQKVKGIYFTACIFTNVTQDHLDFFKEMDAYKKAKYALFTKEYCPLAIVNGDDDAGREIGHLRENAGEEVVFYGLNNPADYFAIITDDSLKGTECVFNLNDELYRVRLPMIGEYNVYNALAAATCAQYLGCENGISKGLFQMKNVCGRIQSVGQLGGGEIYIDFAHTPDGLEKALQTLKKYCVGRLVCLFGCGGNRDKSKRVTMGAIAAKYCDFSILSSDNPRYEDPLDIIAEIERGYRRFSNCYVIVPDRERAIEYGLDFLRQGDILLVAGKGCEEYQEVMGIKYPFNDQNIIEKLLEKKGKK